MNDRSLDSWTTKRHQPNPQGKTDKGSGLCKEETSQRHQGVGQTGCRTRPAIVQHSAQNQGRQVVASRSDSIQLRCLIQQQAGTTFAAMSRQDTSSDSCPSHYEPSTQHDLDHRQQYQHEPDCSRGRQRRCCCFRHVCGFVLYFASSHCSQKIIIMIALDLCGVVLLLVQWREDQLLSN